MLKYILKPLVSYPFLQPFVEEQSDVVILKFKSEKPDLDHSSPVEVFDKIKFILEVLHKYLLSKLSLPFGLILNCQSTPCSCNWGGSSLE